MMVREKKRSNLVPILLPIFFFILIFISVLWGLSSLGQQSVEEQLTIEETSVLRMAVQCYAIEGKYPEDLSYLANAYDLSLDEERFVYHYVNLGDNMMPEIRVFQR